MTYTNSKLATYFRQSPNCNARPNGTKITKIVIHYMAGNMTAKACADYFANTGRQASSTYCIGSDGAIAQSCHEKYRPWTSSDYRVDNIACTIECANIDSYGTITDKCMKSLIKLCADICERNGIKKCAFTGDKSGTLQMHCWYQSTSCPGQYLKGKFSYIAKEVNKLLGVETEELPYKVKVAVKNLNVREKYSTTSKKMGQIHKDDVYTIVKLSPQKKWGKLKSGLGWIKLKYTKRVG